MKRLLLCLCVGLLAGCGGKENTKSIPSPSGTPVFSISVSEYPSWSTYLVAVEKGLIDPRPNYLGPIEQKWGVKVLVKEADYDTCMTLYGSNTVDAVCITTLDALAPSLGRESVVVAPTSTSVGGDMCITVGIDNIDGLKGKATYGLEKSVSQFVFERNLQLLKRNPTDFPFKNMDPAAAAQAMQQGQKNIESIMVWNPFALQTLRTREKAKLLFDSSTIPEEVIDALVVGKDVLAKKGGDKFACAIIDTYYAVCRLMEDPVQGDETYVALGRKFSNLGLADMRLVCQQTRFYNTGEKGLALFGSDKFRTQITPLMVDFCVAKGMVKNKPVVGFNQPDANLNFDDSYMKIVLGK